MTSIPTRDVERLLSQLERLLVRPRGAGTAEAKRVAAAARERAGALAATGGGSPEALRHAALGFASELLSGLWLARPWSRAETDGLVERLAGLVGADARLVRVAVYLGAVRDDGLLELPPKLAIETQLALLRAFTGIEHASLWVAGDGLLPRCVVHVGDEEPSRRTRHAARVTLAGEEAPGPRALLHGVPVRRWHRTTGALVLRATAEQRDDVLPLARETARAVARLLEFDSLLERNASRERALVEATERQLVRLGFDIHDGALQDLAALAAELRLFRSQLARLLEGDPHRDVALGRVADVEARVVAVDEDLRELTRSLESALGVLGPLAESVEHEVERFRASAGIDARLELHGDLDDLTNSQTIVLSRIVAEALENVREHSRATSVRIALRGGRSLLEAEVEDDGVGFDVDRRLTEAARGGRLGLVGMAERVRLLGGRFAVDSRRGGPTRVSAQIPRWRPLAEPPPRG